MSDWAAIFYMVISFFSLVFFSVEWVTEIMGVFYIKMILAVLSTVSGIIWLSNPRWYPDVGADGKEIKQKEMFSDW